MSNVNYSVARVVEHTRASVGKFERHIERKNESYENMNVVPARTPLNVRFKGCGDLTYNAWLDKQIEAGAVSLRGLKKDATVFDEMIFDVNTLYFEERGGYEFAKRFYEEAFHFAEKEYGLENIISAVLHADEQNTWLSEAMDRPIYHYHMHVMAVPVVEKEIRWSKRCKDPALRGTVKKVIHQVSHSKKWASPKETDETGQTQIVKSYSLLQDRFFEHMRDAGFTGFLRGERGSTKEHLSVLEYKVQQDRKHLAEIEQSISEAQEKLDDYEPVVMQMTELESLGKKSFTGKVQMSQEDYDKLTDLAKEGIASRGTIARLQDTIQKQSDRIWDLHRTIDRLQNRLEELTAFCKLYLDAMKQAPQKVKDFLDGILRPKRQPEYREDWDDMQFNAAYRNPLPKSDGRDAR